MRARARANALARAPKLKQERPLSVSLTEAARPRTATTIKARMLVVFGQGGRGEGGKIGWGGG
jgi:hypothetical protein